MAKARALVKRRKAVQNVRKITRTMELIATARFKKAMDRASQAAAYTRKIAELAASLSAAGTELSHPLLEVRDKVENRLLLVIASNRGLCGGYNANVLRAAMRELALTGAGAATLRIEVAGKRAINFFRFQGVKTAASYTHFEDRVTFEQAEELADRYIEWYAHGKLDRLDVAYTRFESASRQFATVETLLPLGAIQSARELDEGTVPVETQYEFIPDAAEILAAILPMSFKVRILKCFLDAAVSEQISRMVAMKGATENAGNMIRAISMQYNRARQAQITSEIAEIVGGAEAIK